MDHGRQRFEVRRDVHGGAHIFQMRIRRYGGIAARLVPYCAIEDQTGRKRIIEAGDGIGNVHATMSFIDKALAARIHRYGGCRQRIKVGIRPEPVVGKGINTQGMPVEAVQANQFGADGLSHPQTVADPGTATALAQFFG